ncbi:MAG: peptidoglycan DD-metalloendopeptidase family protein [Desulfobaccales bacterium]|jgi:murein DD-endopeptidase MepM/ murein hydrolase activator NlpD
MSPIATPRLGKKLRLPLLGILGLLLLGILGWLLYLHLGSGAPWVRLKIPVEVVGPKTALALEAGDKGSGLREVRVSLTQGGREQVVLERRFPPGGGPGEKVEIPFTLEPQALGFKDGKATLTVSVRDRSWRRMFRGRLAVLSQEVVIDLAPATVSMQSVSYLLHAGGTGTMAYRLSKPVQESGVLVGGVLYRGFANPKGAPGDYVVLFPVPQEGPATLQLELVAHSGGQEAKQTIPLRVKPRKWRRDQLKLSDAFLAKVAASLPVSKPGDLLGNYLEINRETRRQNHEQVRQVCSRSSPQPLWSGPFQRFLGKTEAGFGDRRTYVYQNKAVDQQVHMGVDLASLVNSPVPAANRGVVVMAEPLGIYGQTVVIDHGLGVFSMYSHLSQIAVKVDDQVEKGTVLGKTGTTGLAGGDHLHFGVALQGEFVDPIEWWDAHWLKDQVEGVWLKGISQAPETVQAAATEGKGKNQGGKQHKRKPKKKK